MEFGGSVPQAKLVTSFDEGSAGMSAWQPVGWTRGVHTKLTSEHLTIYPAFEGPERAPSGPCRGEPSPLPGDVSKGLS